MSEEGSQNIVVKVEEEHHTFIRKDSEFSKIIKTLNKPFKRAVEVLEGLMESKDEKVAADASKTLINMLLAATKDHNTDQMQRLIAHFRLSGAKPVGQLNTIEDNGVRRPVVNFNDIRQLD